MKPALIDEIREARRALRAEGKDDTQDAVIEKLGKGSKTTMVKYFPFTIPATAAMDPAVAEQESNHTTGGSMPIPQDTVAPATAPAPVETTPMPKLFEARARYHAARAPYSNVERRSGPLKRQIDTCKARQAQLMEERATVATVERLRALKAELLCLDEELEILERDFAPLGKAAETYTREASRARMACEAVRKDALKHLENARRQHFKVKHNEYGANQNALKMAVEVLAEFVGEEDVAKYVTSLTWQKETDRHVPPWASLTWCDASSRTQG